MKLYLSTPGDVSVGIPPDEVTIHFHYVKDWAEFSSIADETPEEFILAIARFFGRYMDGRPRVQFCEDGEDHG